jgi:predicted RNase H-like HicB family nuclease
MTAETDGYLFDRALPFTRVSDTLTLTAVFTPDEDGWTMAQLAEWPAVVTCGRTVEEARAMLLDAAREMVASYRDEGRDPPIGGGHVEQVTRRRLERRELERHLTAHGCDVLREGSTTRSGETNPPTCARPSPGTAKSRPLLPGRSAANSRSLRQREHAEQASRLA